MVLNQPNFRPEKFYTGSSAYSGSIQCIRVISDIGLKPIPLLIQEQKYFYIECRM